MAVTAPMWLMAIITAIAIRRGFSQAATTTYKVTTIIEHPFTMLTGDKTGETKYKGFLIDVLMDLKQSLKVDFDIDLVTDGSYGMVTEEGNWTGLIGHLVRGEADIAAAPLHVGSTRAKTIEFTQPYMMAGPRILMKKRNLAEGLDSYRFFLVLRPFSFEVWLTLIVGYVIASLVLYGIWRWSPFEWGSVAAASSRDARESFNLQNSFLFALSTLLGQGYNRAPRSISGRLLTAVWWMFAVIVLVAYAAALTGHFIIQRANPPIEIRTFDDLALSGMPYGIVSGGKTSRIFQTATDPLRRKMWDQMMKTNPSSMVKSTSEGVERVRKSNGFYAFIVEAPMAEYQASIRPCNVYVTGEPLTDDGYAFACKKGSGICDRLNHALLVMKETTRLHDLRRKWFGGVCAIESEEKAQSKLPAIKSSFHFKDLSFVFLLLACGIIASIVAVGLEIFLNKRGIVKPLSYKDDEITIQDPATEM